MDAKTFFNESLEQLLLSLRKLFWFPYILIMLIVIFFTIIFFVAVGSNQIGFSPVSDKIVNQLAAADSVRDSVISQVADVNACTKALASQYRYIKKVKLHNIDTAKFFEKYYYGFILVLVMSVTFASIMVVIIARNGWQNQRPSIKASFIGFVFVASLSGVLPRTFNNEGNSKKNISRYFYYNNLQTNIYDAVAIDTALDVRCADSTLVVVFSKINASLKEHTDLLLEVNASEIPATPEIGKTITP